MAVTSVLEFGFLIGPHDVRDCTCEPQGSPVVTPLNPVAQTTWFQGVIAALHPPGVGPHNDSKETTYGINWNRSGCLPLFLPSLFLLKLLFANPVLSIQESASLKTNTPFPRGKSQKCLYFGKLHRIRSRGISFLKMVRDV